MSRKTSMREKQREIEKIRNRPSLLPVSNVTAGKSPGPLKRGKPNTFQVKPSPIAVVSGKKPTGSPSYRIKMSFKEGQIQSPKVVPRNKNNPNTQKLHRMADDSVTNLRQDISSLIEKSFASGNDQSTPSSISSGTTFFSESSYDPDDAQTMVGKGIDSLSIDNKAKEKYKETVNDMTSQFNSVNMLLGPTKDQSSLRTKWLGMNEPIVNLTDNCQTMRRQSSAFEICRLPSAIAAREKAKRTTGNTNSIRRQSSAFEIRNRSTRGRIGGSVSLWKDATEEPIYENFERAQQPATRASLRIKNSSVKDLVKKLEHVDSSSRLDAPVSLLEAVTNSKDKRKSLSASALPHSTIKAPNVFNRRISAVNLNPLHTLTEPKSNVFQDFCLSENTISTNDSSESTEALDEFNCDPDSGLDQWMDAKEFFEKTPGPTKNFMILAHPDESIVGSSGCKRSSIIRIRTEKKGLVSKSVQTFTKPGSQASFFSNEQLGLQNYGQGEKSQGQTMLPPTSIPRTPSKPPPVVRHSTANTPQSSRRLSARMGVAGRNSAMSTRNSITSKIVPITPPTAMGVAGAAARRQSIGIRTTNQSISNYDANGSKPRLQASGEQMKNPTLNKKSISQFPQTKASKTGDNNKTLSARGAPLYASKTSGSEKIESLQIKKRVNVLQPENIKLNNPSPNCKSTPPCKRGQAISLSRKSKRIEERRHLTIGYAGENVRSPLKERQNLIVTVQRSKSAQTPAKVTKLQPRNKSSNKNKNRRKQFKDSPYTENSPYSENIFNVKRSMSMRSPQPIIGKHYYYISNHYQRGWFYVTKASHFYPQSLNLYFMFRNSFVPQRNYI